jgi:hypothetical protein
MNGVDLGDINHHRNFVAKFVPHIAKILRNRTRSFLTNPMEQTLELPCVKIASDASTTFHRSRQFTAIFCVVPDSEEPINVIYMGFDLMYSHTGWDTAAGIINCLKMKEKESVLTSDQYLGVSGDGALIHINTHGSLDAHFKVEKGSRHHDVDFMHRAGRVDINIRAEKNFEWLFDMTNTVGDAFKYVNFGYEYEHFFEMCLAVKADASVDFDRMYQPNFYSATRYADSASRVFNTAYHNFPALIRTLEDAIIQRSKGTTDDKKMGEKAENIANKMNTVKFATTLAGLSDIYTVLNSGLKVLQNVYYLPHERLDSFKQVCVKKFNVMLETLEDHQLCAQYYTTMIEDEIEEDIDNQSTIIEDEIEDMDNQFDTEKDLENDSDTEIDGAMNSEPESKTKQPEKKKIPCCWPNLHKEKPDLKKGIFRNQPLAAKHPEYRHTRAGELKVDEERNKNQIEEEIKKLRAFVSRLHADLESKVFDDEDTEYINLLRPITDLKSLAIQLKTEGVETIFERTQNDFIVIAKEVAPRMKTYDVDDIKKQYSIFLRKLRVLCENRRNKDIKSRCILNEFFSTKLAIYKNIESIVYILSAAAVAIGIESIVESHISVFKGIRRNRILNDDRSDDEMFINLNGPPVSKSNLILSEALTSMTENQKCGLHFIRGNKTRRNWLVSKVMDKELDKTSKLPFMN